jgi:hypothetical protein
MKITTVIIFITFALWWGGFTFYATWVVPTAHEVLGNHILAGMITQRVSHVLNVLTGVFIVVALVQFYFERGQKGELIPLSIIALGLIVLLFLHPQMDKFVLTETQSLTDKGAFYVYHRIYLVVSTIMWLAGIVWLFIMRTSVRSSSNKETAK